MKPTSTFKENMAVYADKRIASIFVFGIVSGLPWVMIGSALSIWLKDSGISRTHIGFAGLIYTAYAINYIWAPLVDRVQPRFITSLVKARVGHYKSWIICCQIIIALCCAGISFFEPQTHAKTIVLIALIIAFASSTQDVAIDAFRIKQFDPEDKKSISAAAATTTGGWWAAFAGLGFVPLALSDAGWSWPQLYLLLAGLCLLLTCISLFMPERASQKHDPSVRVEACEAKKTPIDWQSNQYKLRFIIHIVCIWMIPLWAVAGSPGLPKPVTEHGLYVPCLMFSVIFLVVWLIHSLSRIRSSTSSHHGSDEQNQSDSHRLDAHELDLSERFLNLLIETVVEPLSEFFNRNGTKVALGILLFILTFKLGEAFLGRMSIVFYKDIGYSNTEIATYSKMLTMWVTLLCVIPCGLLNARFGLYKGLVISGITMATANLLFSLIAIIGPDINLLVTAVIIDGFTAAWGTVAFVSFISSLCNRRFTATQYALLASLSNLGRTTIAANSGLVVDAMNGNWAIFFLLTTIMVIPSLLLLKVLWPQLEKNL